MEMSCFGVQSCVQTGRGQRGKHSEVDAPDELVMVELVWEDAARKEQVS